MARHGRRPSPAPATRPLGFSPATRHAKCFSPALRRLQGEQPRARPAGFHESRDTSHETRLLCPPSSHGFPVHCCPLLPTIARLFCRQAAAAHHCPLLPGISRLSCRPVTVCLPTTAHYCPLNILPGASLQAPSVIFGRPPGERVSRSSRRPPGSFLCGGHTRTHAEKGKRSGLHEQWYFLSCVDIRPA